MEANPFTKGCLPVSDRLLSVVPPASELHRGERRRELILETLSVFDFRGASLKGFSEGKIGVLWICKCCFRGIG